MLRVAVPNKGALAEKAAEMLREAGYRQRADPKDLVCPDEANDIEFFYLRPKDIATYVGSGDLDVGITGRDLLIDSGAPAEEVVDLAFAGPPSGSPPGRRTSRASRSWAGGGSPPRTRGSSSGTSPNSASRPT